jgi:SNF2 family DNA or RNA helicase
MLLLLLKTDKLHGLPEKNEHTIQKSMPERQLAAYKQAKALNDIRGPQGTLGLIQSLRQISLHPGLCDGKGFDPMDSARFSAMIDILDNVHALGEKVLIFIESLEIQTANQLPLLLQRRYKM